MVIKVFFFFDKNNNDPDRSAACGQKVDPDLDGDAVAALGGDDAVVSVVVNLVVVDGHVVAVVVGVEAVTDVVVHLVVPPVALLVAVRVDPEVEVVDVGVVDVPVDADFFEQLGVAVVLAVPPHLNIRSFV